MKYSIFLFLFPIMLFGQTTEKTITVETDLNIELFPSGLSFMPLKANHQEARTGVLYYFDDANLKVDIGNSIDLLRISSPDRERVITVGMEFMAYAKSTSYEGKRLQIDAIDGFFGGNINYMNQLQKDRILTRFRFIHNSAHLVDGSYDLNQDKWIWKEPIPYTKDFAEITFAYEQQSNGYNIKYFAGTSYGVLVRPENLKRWNYHVGIEAVALELIGPIYNSEGDIFIANFLNIGGADVYSVSHNTLLGVKFGEWLNKGVVFYLSYYNGNDMFSSYFDRRVSQFGAGFSVDF
jgi:hypothetical protein